MHSSSSAGAMVLPLTLSSLVAFTVELVLANGVKFSSGEVTVLVPFVMLEPESNEFVIGEPALEPC
ncbi:hypothetical protein CROQUDRAFT_100902 [Cronartium quercuum f. sp. fusiforme G11]|uniref:Secreted protein n=1 Tax=Cronartium quercuum f. sp. fusiforme G11 TaxID=708437 RepID=A0A9P6N5T2_9BASI|nr:hypothetical protein CROQUDRAFT_100902 [Cronartium quercuum f. sp. fusiforme G11]